MVILTYPKIWLERDLNSVKISIARVRTLPALQQSPSRSRTNTKMMGIEVGIFKAANALYFVFGSDVVSRERL